MIKIHLHLYSILREKLPEKSKGKAVLQFDKQVALADLLDEIGIERRVVISVNGVQETNKSRQLKDGDEVKIFSSVSGG